MRRDRGREHPQAKEPEGGAGRGPPWRSFQPAPLSPQASALHHGNRFLLFSRLPSLALCYSSSSQPFWHQGLVLWKMISSIEKELVSG